MRHRLRQKVFDRKKYNTDKSVIPSSIQESRTPSTFTIGKNPHLTKKNKLHSKSTYFYRWGSSSKLSSSLSYVVPSVCTLALLVGGIIAINPTLNNIEQANAEGPEQENIESEPAAQADTKPTVSLTLISGEAYQQTTAETGKIAYRSNIFQVGGAGITKYSVTLNAANGDTGNLVGRNNPHISVSKVNANTAPASFSDNTWGYSISTRNDTSITNEGMTYNPTPSGVDSGGNNSVELASRKQIVPSTKVEDKHKLTFAAKLGKDLPSDHYEANMYLSIVAGAETLNNISTMQEFTSDGCMLTTEHTTKQLKDIRDDNIYWVTKLKDGNCWMTQNLDYNGGGTSTQASNWVDAKNYYAYYDPGKYYYVNGGTPKTAIDDTTTSEQLHYSIGNYYTWLAANNNVCPRGWQLPTAGNSNGSFLYLLKQYGLENSISSSVDGVTYSVTSNPLYFVYGGQLLPNIVTQDGIYGFYWTSTRGNTDSGGDRGYMLFINNIKANNDTSYQYMGFPIRCFIKAS